METRSFEKRDPERWAREASRFQTKLDALIADVVRARVGTATIPAALHEAQKGFFVKNHEETGA